LLDIYNASAMDWNVAEKIAKEMGNTFNKEAGAGQDLMTLVAAMLLFVASFDESEKDAGGDQVVLKRPDNLREFYASARDCLYSMHHAFPPETGKPN